MSLTASRLTVSVGATPTTASTQNLLGQSPETAELRSLLCSLSETFDVELHAGVYTLLDLQLLTTHPRPQTPDQGVPTVQSSEIALRIQAEVVSVCTERERPEALIGAGTLALAREPCKSYPGWGIVAPSPWVLASPLLAGRESVIYSEENKTGWIVSRISQEHGVLTWQGAVEQLYELHVGAKVMVWPNHACVASAGFGWYLEVDSEAEEADKVPRIIDVWIRCGGMVAISCAESHAGERSGQWSIW